MRRLTGLRRAWRARGLLARAALALLVAGGEVAVLRGRPLAARLGTPVKDAAAGANEACAATDAGARAGHADTLHAQALAREVGWAIETLALRGPLRVRCLAQALAARRLLAQGGVPSRLTLGLARAGSGALQAHAWLRVGDVTVTGGRGRGGFAPVGEFR